MAERLLTDTEICLKCVDENEIVYDDTEKNICRIESTKLDCPESLFHDMLRKIPQCKDVLLMSMKQRALMNEPRIRFYARNDIADMQAKIADIDLAKDSKDYLRDVSDLGYKVLKKYHFFNNLVEFDTERLGDVRVFGKKVKVVGNADMLALTDDIPCVEKAKPTEAKLQKSARAPYSKSAGKHKVSDSNFEDPDEISTVDSVSDMTFTSKSLGKAVVTVLVTARNYISAVDIFRQFLFSYLHNLSKFYILAYHIGPLVEKQEVVLYECNPSRHILKLIKSYKNKTGKLQEEHNEILHFELKEFTVSQTVQKSYFLHSNDDIQQNKDSSRLDVSELEQEFRKEMGKRIHQATPLKDYFRYIVYDCPGVKDHENDNKARYDRYMEKRRKKKETKKKIKAEIRKENDDIIEPSETLDTNRAEYGS